MIFEKITSSPGIQTASTTKGQANEGAESTDSSVIESDYEVEDNIAHD